MRPASPNARRPLRLAPLSLAPLCLAPLCLALGLLALGLLALTALPLTASPLAAQDESAEPAATEQPADTVADMADDWNVDQPPSSLGPTFEVPLEVTEGTWLSLDVSPDGTEIVFDLLGDLYTVPMAGGEARSLTSGMAWDMQPRYSPDGRHIAFTSDRDGGDNLWIVERDGSNPRAVSGEDFRLVNSPAWTPDGQFLAGRKHFTSTRSLGAGEIWLWHVSGGGGLQMVEKPNDQKDLGEPVFSPDGRYLYYSQDVTPGGVFQYNKDPNGAIYAIRRLDRESGETETVISGAGGAVRPTPSPDGDALAFVRRVRTQSVLFVKDLRSGEERPLWDGLDRDMQETWAIHGVYPTMAWTPDASAIVLWAGGGFHRVDTATGEAREIPFRVEDSRTLVRALRVPHEVHPESFEPRMLRWVQVSPTGDRVVFESLGRLWVKELPDGTPRHLSRDEDGADEVDDDGVVEVYPSFSRDGQWVVYATWSDTKLGTVRLVPAAGGTSRTLTTEPGHYVEPVLSPDGETVVYRKTDGGRLRTPTWSSEPGIYRQSLADGPEAVRITAEGVDPHFGADSSRVYLLRFLDEGRRSLVSVPLDAGADLGDGDAREHLTSDHATEFRVSPDGRWVAFREYFAAYVAPFVATGQTQAIGPKSQAVPVRRVSNEAGEYLHWAGDSARLHWAHGPDLATVTLAEALDFLRDSEGTEGTDDTEDDAGGAAGDPVDGVPVATTSLTFQVPTDQPEGVAAFVGGTVITFAGGSAAADEVVLEDATVLVEGHRITAVGPRGEVTVPAEARVFDVAGKTLIPGLVDVHWHGSQGTDEIVPRDNWVNYATLAFGVTTIHDPSNDTSTIFAAAERARAGLVTAPRMYSTGRILYGAKAPFKAVIESPEDARFHVEKLAAVGGISVKSYNQPRRDQRQQVLAAAREAGLLVFPEGGSLFQHNMTMVVDGHTGIEHSIPVATIYDDVRQLWSATEVGYTPTLVVGYGGLWGENYWYAKTDVWANERLLSFVPREILDPRSRRRTLAPDEEWGHFDNARVTAELDDEGVKVLLGAHGQREGLAAHWELWMFEQGGMTPLEALRAATWNGAWYLGMEGDIGSIEAGKLADFVILEASPLENLRNSERIERVVLNGRVYDGESLGQVHPDPAPGPTFFWQREPGFFSALGAATGGASRP